MKDLLRTKTTWAGVALIATAAYFPLVEWRPPTHAEVLAAIEGFAIIFVRDALLKGGAPSL